MITFTEGNLLEARAEALVNTVNTVGVMGKGIALMFKERFGDNYRQYAAACKAKQVQVGKMFVTPVHELGGPRWIVNFPTKQHWRSPSRMEWVVDGLQDLRRFLVQEQVKSVAIPPLGAGNGGLDWAQVRPQIEAALGDLDIEIMVFEPTRQYQNVAKRAGVEKLTPARALIAELVRRYWVLGMECSLLEIQKLAWFLERSIERVSPEHNPLELKFVAHKYGPYANRLVSEYTEVERPFLDQLAAQGWTVIDQGQGVPQDATASLRQHFRQTLLPGVFDEAVRAINTMADGQPWLTDRSWTTCAPSWPATPTAPCWKPTRPCRRCFSRRRWTATS
jgi:O-acetyl-ADP-ribose deacetylase (regulator of RNase III)